MESQAKEIPQSLDEIEKELRKELENGEGSREGWLQHLAIRTLNSRVKNINEDTTQIQNNIKEMRQNEIKRVVRVVTIVGSVVGLSSLTIAAATLV